MPSVLVVDDNPVTRHLIRRCLEGAGMEVREAGSGAEALAEARARAPHIILLDLLLPGTDPAALLDALRALPGGPAMPILGCSGFLIRVEEARAFAGGFDDFLLKPVEPSRLVAKVRALLSSPRAPPGLSDGSVRTQA
jgi:two-component system, OmpR family, response regulator